MASVHFTEEPEEIAEVVSSISSAGLVKQSGDALASGCERFDARWDELKWAQGILNEYHLPISNDMNYGGIRKF